MKTRLFSFVARAFLLYQIVKTIKMMGHLINQYANHRLANQARNGQPRTYYRR